MTMPKVKVACIAAVMQKAMHSDTMGGWAIDWLTEFVEEQPALATHLCAWMEQFSDDTNEGTLTSMTAMIGVLVKSIESQIEADELIKELGV
jgi:hypothetical protein